MKLYTIGFTQKSASRFFGLLQEAGVRHLIDTRLNNISQLAGFAKRDDLSYFLQAICGIAYRHEPLLAPTQEMLDAFKKAKGEWQEYEQQFLLLMRSRGIANVLNAKEMANACLLCSEATPEYCHRRLVAEYLAARWPHMKVEIVHL